MQIKATSPLSHNISGTAKAAFQSLLGFMIWGNEWTVKGILGIFVVLGGSLIYTVIRMREDSSQPEPTPAPQNEIQQEDEEGAVQLLDKKKEDVTISNRHSS